MIIRRFNRATPRLYSFLTGSGRWRGHPSGPARSDRPAGFASGPGRTDRGGGHERARAGRGSASLGGLVQVATVFWSAQRGHRANRQRARPRRVRPAGSDPADISPSPPGAGVSAGRPGAGRSCCGLRRRVGPVGPHQWISRTRVPAGDRHRTARHTSGPMARMRVKALLCRTTQGASGRRI
jgi:hypothetical protein